jgi:Flp pilus assembly CpaE family ATPase
MKAPPQIPHILALTSARPEGATSLAIGLAAVLSASTRTLLMDLNPQRPEIAQLLDVDDNLNVYHLAYRAQLSPVSPTELKSQLRWHEDLAVLPGITNPDQASVLNDQGVTFLVAAAQPLFDHVVLDLGPVQPAFQGLVREASILWVLSPTKLGLASFDRCLERMRPAGASWREGTYALLNQVGHLSLPGVPEFLQRQHGIPTVGAVPHEPDFWLDLVQYSSIKALQAEMGSRSQYIRMFGDPAFHTRKALDELIDQLAMQATQKREERDGTRADGRPPVAAGPSRAVGPRRLPAHS